MEEHCSLDCLLSRPHRLAFFSARLFVSLRVHYETRAQGMPWSRSVGTRGVSRSRMQSPAVCCCCVALINKESAEMLAEAIVFLTVPYGLLETSRRVPASLLFLFILTATRDLNKLFCSSRLLRSPSKQTRSTRVNVICALPLARLGNSTLHSSR